MNYSKLGIACMALAPLAFGSSRAASKPVIIEGAAVATRVVDITPAELSGSIVSEALQRKLSDAARAVCREQYGDDTVYLVTSACFAGSYADGLAEYKQLRARFAGIHIGAAQSVAIAMTAR